MTVTSYVVAEARRAGANVVHTVRDSEGNVVATRRSAHRYEWAICRRASDRSVKVVRWSKSPACPGRHFAIRAVWQDS